MVSIRFLLGLVRSGIAVAWGRWRAQLAAAALTVLAALLVLPAPWAAVAVEAPSLGERELVELRSARSKTFREPDGRLKTTLYEQSVHFLDETAADEASPEGKWVEIDASLKDSAKAGVGWESGANRFRVELAQATRQGLVSFATDAGQVSLSLVGAAVGKAGARVKGNAVAFGEAMPGLISSMCCCRTG